MITKCDFPGCTRAGTCRAPKSRELREYWNFCREHAAEYNKNWNYYANMTPEEIEEDWEKQTFGSSTKRTKQDSDDYIKFLNDFITGRSNFDKIPPKKPSLPSETISAFKTLGLPITASWREVGVKYRTLAKKYHPDTATGDASSADFARISGAYQTLKRYFGK